jgi:hypothetical protein
VRHAGHDTLQRLFGRLHRVQVGQQDHEFIAAQPRDRIHRAQGLLQPLRDLHQQPVARIVAEAVVHGLEAVQVEIGHSEQLAGALGLGHGLLQPVCQQHAVGQPGQRVVVRQLLQQGLLFALLGHVDVHAQHAQRPAIAVARDDLAQVAHPAAGASTAA